MKKNNMTTNDLLSNHFVNQDTKTTHNKSLKKFFLRTMGCQMNVADSNFVAETLINNGYLPTTKLENADIVLVNTCTVRQLAEEKALSFIGELKKFKIKNSKLKIIVIGCAASRLKEKLKKKFPYIDRVIPASDIEKFPEIIKNHIDISTYRHTNMSTCRHADMPTKFIAISRGCSNFCSYCIVPFARGTEITRPKKDVLNDVKKLVSNGRTEITLLGQNVNSYKSGKFDFADLLIELNKIPQIKKINFMTSHPKDMSNKIINTINNCKKVSRQIHLPVQSGSNRILKLMNRKYTKEKYLTIIDKFKKKIPDTTFTTDIIVGFPTETDKDFNQTLKLVQDVGYVSAFTFKYSPRENTKAFSMTDSVPLEIKKIRLAKLNEILKNTKPQNI
ncbi:MAG: tRNA (N6-isopentenyl adenosine(37)-C2)-methylthiotransferase MiaB [Elusimicrobiota bacterium]